MPSVPSVNLSFLAKNKVESATGLIRLADLSEGPLRLQKKSENGVTVKYLGVRSWSTYFFEKLIATPAQKTKAKIKAQVAIEQHVRSFLNNSGFTMAGHSADRITATLHAKVTGRLVTNLPIEQEAALDQKGKFTTAPTFQNQAEVVSTMGKIFRGAATVPTGLSVAVISPLKMIADVRLVTVATFDTHPRSDTSKGMTVSQGHFTTDLKASPTDYKNQYLASLNCVAGGIKTSVVLEVQLDAAGKCSESNLEGAREAATAFVKTRRLQGVHVSVMLTVPELPSVIEADSSNVREIETGSKGNQGKVLLPSHESDESDSSSD